MRRLLPEPMENLSVHDAARDAHRRRVEGRPWVGLCMVSSLDGSIALDGRSGGLGNATDAAYLGALRAVADIVLVGAGTVRAEGYGVPKRPDLRVAVVSRSGSDLDWDAPLFRDGAGLVVTTTDAPELPVETVRAGVGAVDLGAALRMLPGAFVQAEGGAALNGALLDAGLVDELNLTLSPTLVGGAGPRLTRGGVEQLRGFELAQLCEEDSYLFGRWRQVR